ncbi:MAG: YabP/YqfC family sporulation protein [Clostridia bacterium]|nr:YabP/YqfC family sporulation protein [Clostridia bacterium]
MGFIDDIKRCFTPEEGIKEPIYRAVIFGDGAVYLENVCQISYYSLDEIKLSLRRGGLKIKGEELYIKKYCAGDVVICGKIKSIERT